MLLSGGRAESFAKLNVSLIVDSPETHNTSISLFTFSCSAFRSVSAALKTAATSPIVASDRSGSRSCVTAASACAISPYRVVGRRECRCACAVSAVSFHMTDVFEL